MTFDIALRRWLTAIRISVVVLIVSSPTLSGATEDNSAHGQLDGMAFKGMLGPLENRDVPDVLYFKDGKFWSQSCTQLGFAPAPYWTRIVGNEVEFRGFLDSPERGRFSFLGRVNKDHAKVDINWRRDRWYWSIERQMRFEGTLSERSTLNR